MDLNWRQQIVEEEIMQEENEMNPQEKKLERRYRLELGRLARLQKRNDLSPYGEFQFNRQLEITTAAKKAVLDYQQEMYAAR